MGGAQFAFTFTQKDLFRGFNDEMPKRFNPKKKKMSRKEICGKIFADVFFEILLDIIENNVTFVAPLTFGEHAEIAISPIEGEEFIKMYKKGSFRHIDYVLSEFTANRFYYTYKTKKGFKKKTLYLNKELDGLLIEKTHQGKKYY